MRKTSKEAFASFNRSGIKDSHYKDILSVLKKSGDSTCLCISENSILEYHQVQRRMKELETKGLIRVVGRCAEIKNRPLIWGLV